MTVESSIYQRVGSTYWENVYLITITVTKFHITLITEITENKPFANSLESWPLAN